MKVVMNFSKLRDAELSGCAKNIVDKMTGNPNYPTPLPLLADITAAITAYEEARTDAMSKGKDRVALKNEKRAALEKLLKALALYVQAHCGDSLPVLLSSGFEAQRFGGRIGALSKPRVLKVEQGPALGCVKLTVDSVNGAESYRFEYARTPVSETTQWTLEIRTARSLVIQHLTSGQQYAFRAAGIGAEPIVVYSDVVTSFVL
jgi:hypothetical protein